MRKKLISVMLAAALAAGALTACSTPNAGGEAKTDTTATSQTESTEDAKSAVSYTHLSGGFCGNRGNDHGNRGISQKDESRRKGSGCGAGILSGTVGGSPGPHKIQGIGAGFIPKVLDTEIYDEVFPVDNDVPFQTARLLAQTEGILTGISSGAALYAGMEVAKREENEGKTIVVILPDSGDRYYSTPIFTD